MGERHVAAAGLNANQKLALARMREADWFSACGSRVGETTEGTVYIGD